MSATQQTAGGVDAHTGWHGVEVGAVARELGVEPAQGLSASEAASRLRSHGPNRLAGAKKESGVQAFGRQYQDFMQIVLLAAAIINLPVTGDAQWSTCVGMAASLVVVEELIKLILRRRQPHRTIATQTQPAPAGT